MLVEFYSWIKAFHVISVIAWMAAMLYLPRLYVYHCRVAAGSEADGLFKTMEVKLLRAILNPAMIAAWLFGILMLIANPALFSMPWMHVKLAAVIVMSALHGFFARWRKGFVNATNQHSERFYRVMNEVPAVLMVVIVIMVIAQPF
ncbi:MAG: protoporphyrinogen oxidase HemJ [Pseudomonadota bacterium]